jgi:GDP-L-fucose synthase
MKAAAPSFALEGRRVFVAGHRGMVGRAVVRRLGAIDCEILTAPRAELDLLDQRATFDWLEARRPDVLVLAAAKVGGILANSVSPADFLYQNLAIETNLIEGARRAGIAKLLFLGSSCIYPKFAGQPIVEDSLLAGPLEPTNEWYAVAKIAGVKLCDAYRRQYGCDFISAMPTNLYGPYDNFDLASSHVLPALLAKLHDAQEQGRSEVSIWGTGKPRREFLHVDDLADAAVFLLQHYSSEGPINVGTGQDLPIAELATLIARVVGWRGQFVYDHAKPDGTPRKLLDVGKLGALGWRARIALVDGIGETYRWYLEHAAPVAAERPTSRVGA